MNQFQQVFLPYELPAQVSNNGQQKTFTNKKFNKAAKEAWLIMLFPLQTWDIMVYSSQDSSCLANVSALIVLLMAMMVRNLESRLLATITTLLVVMV